MNESLEKQVENLQRDVIELHNLFDLNMIANQSRTIEELLSKVSMLVKTTLGLVSMRFFISNNGILQTKLVEAANGENYEFSIENAPFLQEVNDKLINVENHSGKQIIYMS